MAHDGSLFAAYIGMLLCSHVICVSLVQPPTLMYQQPCAVVSLVSTSLAWSDRTAPWLHPLSCCSPTASSSAAVPWLCPPQLVAPRLCPLQLLLPDYILFSCCSLSVSACYHAHAVQSIISTKVAHGFSIVPTGLSASPLLWGKYKLLVTCWNWYFWVNLAYAWDVYWGPLLETTISGMPCHADMLFVCTMTSSSIGRLSLAISMYQE